MLNVFALLFISLISCNVYADNQINSIVHDFFFSSRFDMQRRSSEQLDSLGAGCIPILIEALSDTSFHLYPGDDEEFDRKAALEIIGRICGNTPGTFTTLLAQEYNPYHHLIVEYYAENCWKDSSSRPLLKFLDSKNKRTREAMVVIYLKQGLGLEIIPQFKKMVEDTPWTNSVPEALNLIKPKEESNYKNILLGTAMRLKACGNGNCVNKEIASCVRFRLESLIDREAINLVHKYLPIRTDPGTMEIKKPIRLLSLNANILFDECDNPYKLDDRLRGKRPLELKNLAEYFKNRDADIVTLQEVEAGDFLEFYNSKYLSNLGYKAYTAPSNDYRGYSIGFLSRLPLGRVTSHHLKDIRTPTSTFHFIRDIIQLEVLTNTGIITIFNTHCQPSSISSMYSKEHWKRIRKDEAKAINDIINEEASNYKMIHKKPMDWIFCGDFNLTPDDTLYKILTDSKQGETWTDIAKFAGKDEFTSSTTKPEERIDYIFVSSSMLKRYLTKSFNVEKQDSLAKRISDHFGISSSFSGE